MIAWIANAASGLWLKAAAAAAVLAAIAGIYLSIRKGGRDAERADNAIRTTKAVQESHEVDSRVDAATPVELERLRNKWTRG